VHTRAVNQARALASRPPPCCLAGDEPRPWETRTPRAHTRTNQHDLCLALLLAAPPLPRHHHRRRRAAAMVTAHATATSRPGAHGRLYSISPSALHASVRTHPGHPHTRTSTPACHTGSYQDRHVGPPSQREGEKKEGRPPSPTRPTVLSDLKTHQPRQTEAQASLLHPEPAHQS
jgi:hypothetical protein